MCVCVSGAQIRKHQGFAIPCHLSGQQVLSAVETKVPGYLEKPGTQMTQIYPGQRYYLNNFDRVSTGPKNTLTRLSRQAADTLNFQKSATVAATQQQAAASFSDCKFQPKCALLTKLYTHNLFCMPYFLEQTYVIYFLQP